MSGATFVECPDCGRFMLGQRAAGTVYPQPHSCPETQRSPAQPTPKSD